MKEIAALPDALKEAAAGSEEQLHSAARGGAKTALGLMMAHYPEAKPWRVASGVPAECSEEDEKRIFSSVAGYASKISGMVSLGTKFPFTPCPATPEDSSDDEDYEEATDELEADADDPAA